MDSLITLSPSPSPSSSLLLPHPTPPSPPSPLPFSFLPRPSPLPQCSGLRLCLPPRPSPPVVNSRAPCRASRGRGGGGIVSEQQQDTISVAGEVTVNTWNKLVLESEIPVLIDFWAPWCGPCRMIAPLIDELARQYAGRLRCLKLNTDESPNIATEYGIRSIPTVMIFKRGEKKDTVIGAVPKATLTATIEKYLDW